MLGQGFLSWSIPVSRKLLENKGAGRRLSIPGICGRVKRPEKVLVKALDENGKPFDLEGTGLLARALCHEIDHLDGILFIDKVIPGSIINQNDLAEVEVI